MKIWAKVFALGFTFSFGVGVGVGTYHLRSLDPAAADSKARWFVWGIHQSALRDRAEQHHQKFGRWPTNVQKLVEAHFLPAFLEVHFCPSQVSAPTRTYYEGPSWVDQNQTRLVAYYISSSYRFRVEGSNFTVSCSFDREHKQ